MPVFHKKSNMAVIGQKHVFAECQNQASGPTAQAQQN
jgi:hypothetical protein